MALTVALDLAPTFEALISGIIVVRTIHIARLYSGPTGARMQGIYGGVLTARVRRRPDGHRADGMVGLHTGGSLFAFPGVSILAIHALG